MELFPQDKERSNPVYDGMVMEYILSQIPAEKRPLAKERLSASLLLRNVSSMDYVFNVTDGILETSKTSGDVVNTTEMGFTFVATSILLHLSSETSLDVAKSMRVNVSDDVQNRKLFAAPACVSVLGATFGNEVGNYGRSEPFEIPYFIISENTPVRLSWFHDDVGLYAFKMRAVLSGIKFGNELLRIA